jgi:hypothetical protein
VYPEFRGKSHTGLNQTGQFPLKSAQIADLRAGTRSSHENSASTPARRRGTRSFEWTGKTPALLNCYHHRISPRHRSPDMAKEELSRQPAWIRTIEQAPSTLGVSPANQKPL